MLSNVPFLIHLFALSDDRSCLLRNRRRGRFAGKLPHCIKFGGANLNADSAFYAHLLVDDVDLVLAARDSIYRASPGTNQTGQALVRVNVVRSDFAKKPVDLL